MEIRKRGTLIASWADALARLARRAMGERHPERKKRGEIRYRKPNMTNLPYKLGKEIFEEILSSPPPDYAKMREESALLVQEMLKERQLDNG